MDPRAVCGAALIVAIAVPAAAQVSKTLSGETKVVTVTVESIEKASREITVKKADGTYESIFVPSAITRFDTLKIGDRITAKYYETVVLRMTPPGQKDANAVVHDGLARTAERPSATASQQQTITATITAIDAAVPSITFTGPRGWTYSSRVEDTQALAKVKVGDRVDITWTEALILSIDDAK